MLTVVGLAVRPGPADPARTVGHVVIVGAAGLRWDDVDRNRTPHLWDLAERGTIGSLAVRSAREPTCAVDGWLTLGAGNWAAGPQRPTGSGCPDLDVTLEPSGANGAYLPRREAVVRENRWHLPWEAMPGALAGAVDCTTAVGEGATLAGARAYGRVDRYLPRVPQDPQRLESSLAQCELGIVDVGAVRGDGASRAATAAAVDRVLARVLAARPPDTVMLVAGIADSGADRRLRVAVAHGPGLNGGWLSSETTGRRGYLQLVDLAPTALEAVGRPEPQVRLAGHPATRVSERPDRPDAGIAELVAADAEAERTRPVRAWFLAGLAVAQLALLVALAPLLRRSGWPPPVAGGRWRATAPVLLVASAVMLPAALVTSGVPWWRGGATGAALAAACLVIAVATGAVMARTAAFRTLAGVTGVCATVAVAAVAADLLTGSRLQLNSVVGYSAHDGDRYAGLGPVAAGLLVAGTLLGAGCLAQRVRHRWRPATVVAVGAVGIVLSGNAYLGADIGTAVALTAGVCVAAALSTGGWLTAARMMWAAAAGAAVTGGVLLAELGRPPEHRSGLGGTVTALVDGTAGFGLKRLSLANWEALVASPMTLLALGSLAFLWLVLLRPWGGLKRVFGTHPALRAGMVGTAVAATVAGVVTGAALTVAGAAAAVVLPLATFAALRVRQWRARSSTPGDAPTAPDSTDPKGKAAEGTADGGRTPNGTAPVAGPGQVL